MSRYGKKIYKGIMDTMLSELKEMPHSKNDNHRTLGMMYFVEFNDFDKAKEHFSSYLEKEPNGKYANEVKRVLQNIKLN